MLEIKNLTKKFGDFTAVENVSLKIEKGEFFSIIGPNGSGKTTIIKNILGLLHPTEGQILVNEKSIEEDPKKVKSKIGYIPDEPKIWSHITGEEFLFFSGNLYGIDNKQIEKKIPELLKNFNLKGIEKKYFENYSRGNKQKFTILAALLHDPDLILVDEPIVGLDPQAAESAMELLNNFVSEGGSVFMATHTLPVAQEHSDRVGVLHEGKLVETGTIENLREKMGDPEASLLKIYHHFSQND